MALDFWPIFQDLVSRRVSRTGLGIKNSLDGVAEAALEALIDENTQPHEPDELVR